ncbi:MAG: hypothetical protein EOP06_09975 [Proteobacteria bacterium]|nr:MAG: hypothetical protein EOP06_09975 [Pseudomonadota bacterium]
MLRNIMLSASVAMFGSAALAAPITGQNLVGRYRVEASALFKKVKINFRVLNSKEFEIQQLDREDNPEELCNGTYSIAQSMFNANETDDFATTVALPVVMQQGQSFIGQFTCPSDRSKVVDFNIDFQNKTTDDLVRGTTVVVTTSMAPMKIKATVIRVN